MSDDPRLLAAKLLPGSRFALSLGDARAQIAARREQLLATPLPAVASDPDFCEPAPLPILDDPQAFATEYWKHRSRPLPDPPKPKKRAGRPPKKADAKPELHRFRVIDGGGDKPRKR